MRVDPGADYFRWYYDTAVWKRVAYRGVRTLKSVSDMWNYQEIITERGIQWVLETGTRHGGSALFFADLLTAGNAEGFVISIDVSDRDNWVRTHPRVRFLVADSAAPATVAEVTRLLAARRAPMFVILDSDHVKAHVLRELAAWLPVMRRGDYLVVEDTCINGHPVRPHFGPGPFEAVEEFLKANPGALVPDPERERKFGFTCAPNGFFVRA